jgi:Flp pilus assembly pilin Flp
LMEHMMRRCRHLPYRSAKGTLAKASPPRGHARAKLAKDTVGASTIETAMLIALVTILFLGIAEAIGVQLSTIFTETAEAIWPSRRV